MGDERANGCASLSAKRARLIDLYRDNLLASEILGRGHALAPTTIIRHVKVPCAVHCLVNFEGLYQNLSYLKTLHVNV